jgi:hypothetical protein
MNKCALGIAGAAALLAGSVASATPVLQFDVNSFAAQAQNAGGSNTPFGGLSHSGKVAFTAGAGTLNGIFIQNVLNGPFQNANLGAAFSLSTFSGEILLNNGQVTGGNITLTINNGDSYTCNISPNSGLVTTFVGGGFKIEALTQGGMFSDSVFGNVNVAPWFNTQGIGGGLPGSFLQFNFTPNASGAATADMDLFVDVSVIPLPPAAWMGLSTLCGIVAVRRLKRR